VLRFAIPAGTVVAAARLAAYLLARAGGLPPGQQRTSAVFVAVILSLAVLTLLAVPLTWRRSMLVAEMIAAFALLFPAAAVRHFYALALPGHGLWLMLLISAAGSGLVVGIWRAVSRPDRATRTPGGR
jgi:hypothetical protein